MMGKKSSKQSKKTIQDRAHMPQIGKAAPIRKPAKNPKTAKK